MELILGSSSAARKELLTRLKIPFTAASPDIDETPLAGELPQDLVIRLAVAKARKITERHPHALVIGCDQVGTLEGKILGKPENHQDAIAQLEHASGHSVVFMNGLCIFNAETSQVITHFETFTVHFKELTSEMIQHYLEKEKPYACAGSFRSEGLGIALLTHMEGQDPTSLMGLPLIALVRILGQMGIKII